MSLHLQVHCLMLFLLIPIFINNTKIIFFFFFLLSIIRKFPLFLTQLIYLVKKTRRCLPKIIIYICQQTHPLLKAILFLLNYYYKNNYLELRNIGTLLFLTEFLINS